MEQRYPVQIIGASGQLWLIAPNPKKPGEAMTLRIDFKNRQRIEYIRQNLKQYIPTTGYHFSCDSCQMTNAAQQPQPTVTCVFCGYTTKNDNYKAWQKLRRILDS
jgi:hypothetical protein